MKVTGSYPKWPALVVVVLKQVDVLGQFCKVVGVNIKLASGDKKFKCGPTLKGGPPGKRSLGRFKNEQEDKIQMDLREMGCEDEKQIFVPRDRVQCQLIEP